MFCVGLILYEMLLPPMVTSLERYKVFEDARVCVYAFFEIGWPFETKDPRFLQKTHSSMPRSKNNYILACSKILAIDHLHRKR